MEDNTQETEEVSLATVFMIKHAMRDFYAVPENQAKFEEWLAKRKEKERQNK